jgi:PleD family two-component response regulator
MISKKSVLLVLDENYFVYKKLTSFFSNQKYTVHIAKNEHEAMASSSLFNIDCLIISMKLALKINTPMFKSKKEGEICSKIPTIILNETMNYNTIKEAFAMGVSDIMPENFNESILEDRLEQLLSKSSLKI